MGRIVQLSFFYDHEVKHRIAKKQFDTSFEVSRATILDRNGEILATNLKTSSLYANPQIIQNPTQTARNLAKIFPEVGFEKIAKELSKDSTFTWIKRNIHPRQKYEVNALGIPGLYFQEEEKRSYPQGNLTSHILGMVDVDNKGISGLEKYFTSQLARSKDGENEDINTSIDIRVQSILHEELEKQFIKHKAVGATGIIMDVSNGEIIAMVSLPDFDPNLPSKIDPKTTFNIATAGSYEMGSTMKAFTVANGFESGAIKINDVFDATNGIKIGKFTIDDYHGKHRPLTVPEIIMYSSNIGTAKIAEKVGAENMRNYFKKFGFFDKMKFEIPELSHPLVPKDTSRITNITTSFGHGIAVSPLHLVSAFAALVNDGKYYNPTLVKNKNEKPLKTIFSKHTSEEVKKILRLVVSEGTARKADVDGYMVAGKTGTADKLDARGRYDENKRISSFLAVFPVNKPRYAILTMFDEPKPSEDSFGYATAGWVACPAVNQIVTRMAPLLGLKPQDMTDPKIVDKYNLGHLLAEKGGGE
jgi:cell division protein FtsI (penicillin-binding protein 3)